MAVEMIRPVHPTQLLIVFWWGGEGGGGGKMSPPSVSVVGEDLHLLPSVTWGILARKASKRIRCVVLLRVRVPVPNLGILPPPPSPPLRFPGTSGSGSTLNSGKLKDHRRAARGAG